MATNDLPPTSRKSQGKEKQIPSRASGSLQPVPARMVQAKCRKAQGDHISVPPEATTRRGSVTGQPSITPACLQKMRAVAAQMTTEELKSDLATLLGYTADTLARLACIVSELEGRGEDLSELKIGLLPILRQIADGKLLPDLVVMLSGKPGVLFTSAKLPVSEQKKIIEGKIQPPKHYNSNRKGAPRGYLNDGNDDDNDDDIKPIKAEKLSIHAIANKAGARDIADMVAEMILSSPHKLMILRHLSDRLASEGLATLKLAS
jgi:hypothetical protein